MWVSEKDREGAIQRDEREREREMSLCINYTVHFI